MFITIKFLTLHVVNSLWIEEKQLCIPTDKPVDRIFITGISQSNNLSGKKKGVFFTNTINRQLSSP